MKSFFPLFFLQFICKEVKTKNKMLHPVYKFGDLLFDRMDEFLWAILLEQGLSLNAFDWSTNVYTKDDTFIVKRKETTSRLAMEALADEFAKSEIESYIKISPLDINNVSHVHLINFKIC